MGDQFGNSDADLDRGDLELMRWQEDDTLLRPRTHFVRLLTLAKVNATIDLLNTVCDEPFPHIHGAVDTFKIRAPDGDEVFTGVFTGGVYVCRLHLEVFDEGLL